MNRPGNRAHGPWTGTAGQARRAPRRVVWPLAWLVSAALLLPATRLSGQAGPALAGAALGAAGGAAISLAIVTAEAHTGRYLYSTGDLGWRIAPIPAAAVGGAILGYRDGERLRNAALAGLLGAGAGGVAGTVIGSLIGRSPEAAWSGWIVGGTLGLLAGTVIGALEPTDGATPGPQLAIAWTIRR